MVCRQFNINFVIIILVCLSTPVRYVVLRCFGCAALHCAIFEDIRL